MIDVLTEEHTIVIPSYVIDEMKLVVAEKFAHKYNSLDRFLTNLHFELAYTPETIDAEKYPAYAERWSHLQKQEQPCTSRRRSATGKVY